MEKENQAIADSALLMADYHFGSRARLTEADKARLAVLKAKPAKPIAPPAAAAPAPAEKKSTGNKMPGLVGLVIGLVLSYFYPPVLAVVLGLALFYGLKD